MTTPLEIVRQFINLIETKEIDLALALLDPNISYENMPTKPVVGIDNVGRVLTGFLGPASQVDWRIISECAAGDTVYNERLDRFMINGVWLDLPIAGVFKVAGGKIILWRDYFDMGTYMTQFSKIMKPSGDEPA